MLVALSLYMVHDRFSSAGADGENTLWQVSFLDGAVPLARESGNNGGRRAEIIYDGGPLVLEELGVDDVLEADDVRVPAAARRVAPLADVGGLLRLLRGLLVGGEGGGVRLLEEVGQLRLVLLLLHHK